MGRTRGSVKNKSWVRNALAGHKRKRMEKEKKKEEKLTMKSEKQQFTTRIVLTWMCAINVSKFYVSEKK